MEPEELVKEVKEAAEFYPISEKEETNFNGLR